MIGSIQKESPLVLIFISYASGIIINHYCNLPIILWMLILTLFIIVESIIKNHKSNLYIFFMLFFLGGTIHSRQNTLPGNHINNQHFINKVYIIQGEIESKRIYSDKIKLVLNNLNIDSNNYSGKLLLTIKNRKSEYFSSQVIQFNSKMINPLGRRNPGAFDYAKYLHRKNIYKLCYQKKEDYPILIKSSGLSPFYIASKVKGKIFKMIDDSMTGEQANILKALIIGARDEINDKTEQLFINSGIIHILAVSGLHVGYVTFAFWILFGFLRFPYKTRTILTILALIFYAMMVDMKPSVTRAVIMASIILIGRAWEKKVNVYNSLAAAAFIQTLYSPFLLFDIGFQLSFSAVFSIVYFNKRITTLLPEKIKPLTLKISIFRNIYQLFLISFSALIGTLPLTAYYFHRVSLISLIANLFAIPLVGIIGALGFSQIILGFIWNSFNIAYGRVEMILITILQKLTSITGESSFAYFQIKEFSIVTAIILYFIILGLVNFDNRKIKALTISGILFLLNFHIWSLILQKPELKITYFDVGQGDAAYIEFPSGKNMLVDTADKTFNKNYAKYVILPYFQRQNIKKIDYLELSHPHSDHIGGAPFLLKNIKIGEIWETDKKADSRCYKNIYKLADSLNIKIKKIYGGDFIPIDEFCNIFILHPTREFLSKSPPGYNDYSTTFKLTFGKTNFIFTGDIEHTAESYISNYGDFLNCEIMKVPHHGSKTSSTINFIQYIHPEYALISVGKGNKFKHPSQKTIEKYQNMGVNIHRTDYFGAMIVTSNGKNYSVKTVD